MAFRRRRGNEAKSRKEQKRKDAKRRWKESVRSALHFINQEIWRERSARGDQREEHVTGLLKILCKNWEILNFAIAGKSSWMNHVLKADHAAQRLFDKVVVPIQVKAKKSDVIKFLAQHGEDCIRMYGAFPIMVIAPADGFRNPLSRALALLHEINVWNGVGFDYRPWMSKNSEVFSSSRLGDSEARIREFMRRHPEYFEPGLQCGFLEKETEKENR